MSPHVRVIAAVLIPLVALTSSCSASRPGVRLQFGERELMVEVPANRGAPIDIPEPELWASFQTAARAFALRSDPLAAAEQTFDVAEGSGSYRYYAPSGRLIQERGLAPAEDSTEQLTREYLEWCGGTRLGGGDCLHLLHHTQGISLHGRYVVALVMSMTASFGPMLESLKEFADPNAVAVMLASAVAMYLVLLLVPEPISKLISLSITGALIGYLGLNAFWELVYGWRALVEKVDEATDFTRLQAAARDFGRVLGPRIGQLLILLVCHSLGKGLAANGATSPPRIAEASAQAEHLLRVRLAAGAVQAVSVGASTITISLATSATAAGVPEPTAEAPVSRPFGGLSRAAEFGIRPYRELQRALRGTGLQAHHLIEQRFQQLLAGTAREGLSIAVTAEEHQAFTNAWRQLIPYGPEGTGSATTESVLRAARQIYASHPEILRALGL